MNEAGGPVHYEIRVKGILDAKWADWFDSLVISTAPTGETSITGPLPDQAALHGLLAKVRDLGLPLVAVRQLGPGQRGRA
ncbi:MAG TPA: hypothetical protein VIV12_01370 [Streptosporangiaceae bacterium]